MEEFNYITSIVRSAAILTNSYVAGTVLNNLKSQDKLVVLADFTKGSLTSAEIKIEYSIDGTTWFQESTKTVSGGVITEALAEHTMAATGLYYIPLDMKAQYARISVKGTGTVTASSMAIKVIVGQDL
jgi:hypothetical protein